MHNTYLGLNSHWCFPLNKHNVQGVNRGGSEPVGAAKRSAPDLNLMCYSNARVLLSSNRGSLNGKPVLKLRAPGLTSRRPPGQKYFRREGLGEAFGEGQKEGTQEKP